MCCKNTWSAPPGHGPWTTALGVWLSSQFLTHPLGHPQKTGLSVVETRMLCGTVRNALRNPREMTVDKHTHIQRYQHVSRLAKTFCSTNKSRQCSTHLLAYFISLTRKGITHLSFLATLLHLAQRLAGTEVFLLQLHQFLLQPFCLADGISSLFIMILLLLCLPPHLMQFSFGLVQNLCLFLKGFLKLSLLYYQPAHF